MKTKKCASNAIMSEQEVGILRLTAENGILSVLNTKLSIQMQEIEEDWKNRLIEARKRDQRNYPRFLKKIFKYYLTMIIQFFF